MGKRLLRSHTWKGVTLRAGLHLWSNPSLRGTDAAIPIVMSAPTLFDLVVLAEQKSVEELKGVNDRLLAQGEITERQHARTNDFLNRIEQVNHGRP
ncbi:hypothetical protein LMG19282_02989 [Cupriavidus campinensis]|uniref:hypothetical protein n=1 Tax=Cupriavidus campinensis TaxID=151783 RepID=UPI001B26F7F9|nr:hypothetical protein [Cupriavidus campinensis]CAG2146653.1 hypothetical protein LMG19282_02989 [Cupriavidus campinensis]